MIFIPYNVPSLKNSKSKGIFPSKSCKKYLQKIGIFKYSSSGVIDYRTRENIFRKSVGDYFDIIEYPAIIGFHFIRNSRRRFDFHNAVQIVADLLTAHGFIEDDNMDFFLPFPMTKDGSCHPTDRNIPRYSIDKENPGVLIKKL